MQGVTLLCLYSKDRFNTRTFWIVIVLTCTKRKRYYRHFCTPHIFIFLVICTYLMFTLSYEKCSRFAALTLFRRVGQGQHQLYSRRNMVVRVCARTRKRTHSQLHVTCMQTRASQYRDIARANQLEPLQEHDTHTYDCTHI